MLLGLRKKGISSGKNTRFFHLGIAYAFFQNLRPTPPTLALRYASHAYLARISLDFVYHYNLTVLQQAAGLAAQQNVVRRASGIHAGCTTG
jgi:hypothetical protein